MLREARESLPELPAARSERYVRSSAWRRCRARCSPPTPRRPSTSSGSPARRRGRAAGGRQLGDRRAGRGAAPGAARRGALRVAGQARARWPRWSSWSPRRGSPTAPASRCWRCWSRRGASPKRSSSARGSPRSPESGELEAIVAAAIEANPEAAEQIRAGNERAIGAIVGAVMRETKGRADGGEVNRLIRARLAEQPSGGAAGS